MKKVSIIIPVKNEENYIERCLEQLVNQTYPTDKTEILVIDGMSTDRTREIVKKFVTKGRKLEVSGWRSETRGQGREVESERLEVKENKPQTSNLKHLPVIRLIDNPKGHRASALNIGIKEANGDVIMRIDARTVIAEDYIEKCVKTLIETGADNVGGMQKPIIKLEVGGERLEAKETAPRTSNLRPQAFCLKTQTLTQTAIGMALSHPFGVGNAEFRLGRKSGFVDTVYLGCFRKEIFDKVGLFDEEAAVISEDADMNYRIRKAGGKVYFNKDIVAYYYPRDSFKDLWKLYFRYGGAKAGNLLKRGSLTAWRQFIPPSFLLSLVVLPILAITNSLFFYLWFMICSVYLGVDLVVSAAMALKSRTVSTDKGEVSLSLKERLFLFPKLLSAFPIMHFSWAMGFWRRLLQRPKPGEYWGG